MKQVHYIKKSYIWDVKIMGVSMYVSLINWHLFLIIQDNTHKYDSRKPTEIN